MNGIIATIRTRKLVASHIARLFSGDTSQRTAGKIGDWQAADATYQHEFVETLHALSDMGELAGRASFQSVLAEADGASVINGRARRWRGVAMAASALLIMTLGLGALIGFERGSENNGNIQRYLTRIGEQKTVDLPDGSVITLNTASEILVDVTGEYRRVTLERGEAYFKVAKNPERTFSVDVGARSVSVLGTQFNIHKTPDQFTLSVVEGIVALHKKEEQVDVSAPLLNSNGSNTVVLQSPAQQRLRAGWVVAFNSEQNKLTGFVSDNLEPRYSWRTGLLSFEGVPLYKVVQELNRYSAKKILIEDTDIIDMEIFAAIKVDKINSAIYGLERTHPLKVTHYFDRIVFVGKK